MPAGVIRVLHIARYRAPAMERKLELMAADPAFAFWLARPAVWEDEYGRREVNPAVSGCRILRLPMWGRASDPHRALYRTLSFGMIAIRPHLIHAEEEPDSLAALQIALARRLFAPRARLILHTWQNVNRPKGWPVRAVLRITLGAADAILCANREGTRVLGEMGYRGPVEVIPPIGVDTRVFRPVERRPEPSAFRAAYAGRFVPEKGIEILLQAAARLGPSVELWLIGGGPQQALLRSLARELGIEERVRWVRSVPPERMPELLAQVDALVLPSRTTPIWKEQFGRVLVEAMACGVPVVGSDSGAIPEVMGDAGLIFPEGDAAALADRLRRLMEDPGLRRELGERGYRRAVSLYSQEVIAGRTLDFYRKIMGRGSSGDQ
ncbi:glycosyltransferase [Thermoflexus sp.]|uniref:glycosyltransferase n=2 Tax=Thermoflexus sp. TaxID=1969742 RepID=UPI0025CEB207|nr:glycosyltransferase [Thermoflexus sp.]MCS6964985.1 glycosyltransferase family 4 protein [Thermoflexus sp.]MCX7690772.1 glycosyltransferase family 4 protein [Thermoflexus sp.]MDW8184615.1 glycosyltransferase [Anaerolineae bacterium]